jgi:hypothetical protein
MEAVGANVVFALLYWWKADILSCLPSSPRVVAYLLTRVDSNPREDRESDTITPLCRESPEGPAPPAARG